MKQFQFYKLFSPFLSAFLHLRFFKKHMLNDSECFFWGEEGLSGLTAGSVWLIVQGGKGALIHETKSPDFRSLEVGISGKTIIIKVITIIINHLQEIEGEPEFCLKEIQTGITLFSSICIGNEKFKAIKSMWILLFFVLLNVMDERYRYSIYGFDQGLELCTCGAVKFIEPFLKLLFH